MTKKYKLQPMGFMVQRTTDKAFIPLNVSDNKDFQEYQEWLNEGNTPDAADEENN